jgi:hypothetical protein
MPRRAVLRTQNPELVIAAVTGKPATIEYDPKDPTQVRAVGESASLFGYWVFLPGSFVSSAQAQAGVSTWSDEASTRRFCSGRGPGCA